MPGHVLIAEDDRFYRHRGVDWVQLRGAMRHNMRKRSLARGASTIDGREVLLHQAIRQFELMTGKELPMETSRELLGLEQP